MKKVRHGDVLIIPVDKVSGKIVNRTMNFENRVVENCLKQGEAVDHFHRVKCGDVTFREDEKGTLYMSVESDSATITHEEHGDVELKKGNYGVYEQREYHPDKEKAVYD